MLLNVRFDGDVTILSNFGGLLNDPRHFEASRDVRALLDQGRRQFIFELAGIREMGSTAMGLLVTLTRVIRQGGGEVVLARLSRATKQFLDEMQMEEFWDQYDNVEEAKGFFGHAED